MPVYNWQKYKPCLAASVWIAPDAQVIGQVEIGAESSIWFGCILRGDVGPITIGAYSNIQDLSLLHLNEGQTPLEIGDYCTVGHHVTLHGCQLHDHAFVGIGATVLDGCEIGSYGLLAAGSLLASGKKIAAGMLAMGTPAREVRPINDKERYMIENTAPKYAELQKQYRSQEEFHT